jgi:hypothetical protein
MKSVFPSAAIRNVVIRQYEPIECGSDTIDHLEQELKNI